MLGRTQRSKKLSGFLLSNAIGLDDKSGTVGIATAPSLTAALPPTAIHAARAGIAATSTPVPLTQTEQPAV
jgi:hypothetical protein